MLRLRCSYLMLVSEALGLTNCGRYTHKVSPGTSRRSGTMVKSGGDRGGEEGGWVRGENGKGGVRGVIGEGREMERGVKGVDDGEGKGGEGVG